MSTPGAGPARVARCGVRQVKTRSISREFGQYGIRILGGEEEGVFCAPSNDRTRANQIRGEGEGLPTRVVGAGSQARIPSYPLWKFASRGRSANGTLGGPGSAWQ